MDRDSNHAPGDEIPPQPLAWIDGEIIPAAEARIPFDDRGFLFGEAAYEVMLSFGRKLFAKDAHLRRLGDSLVGVGIPPEAALERVAEGMDALLAASAQKEGMVYVQVTGGVASRNHLPPEPQPPCGVYLGIRAFDGEASRAKQEEGIGVILHEDRRWQGARWKSTQLVPNVLALREAARAGASEALLHSADRVLEAASSNLFVVRDGRCFTPPLEWNILPGVTRALLLSADAALESGTVLLEDLHAADELFLTSTTKMVTPVISVNGRPVGDGKPGPRTRELQDVMTRILRDDLQG